MLKPHTPSLLPGSLRMLVDRQRLFLSEGLDELFGRVSEAFFEAADAITDSNVQASYFDAIKILRAQRGAIQEAVLESAAHELEALFHVGKENIESQAFNSSHASGLSLSTSLDRDPTSIGSQPEILEQARDQFGLDENEELEMIVNMDTMVSAARARSHHILPKLSGRIATVLGRFPNIARSPLDPEYLVTSFSSCCANLTIGPAARASLLTLFEQSILSGLSDFLEECDALLAGQGVKPAYADEFQRDVSEKQLSRKPIIPSERGFSVAENTGASCAVEISRRMLTELPSALTREMLEASGDIDYPDLSGTVTSLLQLDNKVPDDTGYRSIHEQLDEELIRQGHSFDELHPVDRQVVRLMDVLFEQIGKWGWFSTLAEGSLDISELAAVNLAISDPGFLDQEYHPARRLLNEVAAVVTSFQANSELAADPLYQKINDVISQLGVTPDNIRGVTDLLSDFMEFVARDNRRCVGTGLRTMEEAITEERVNEAYELVERTLKLKVCGPGVPLFVLDLVEQAWCKVLFFAYLEDGADSLEWQTGVHLLDQLMGLIDEPESVDPDYLQKLTAALASSLEQIAYDPVELDRLLTCIETFFATDYRRYPLIALGKDEARKSGQYFIRVLADDLELAIPGEPRSLDEDLLAQLEDVDLSRVDSLALDAWVEFHDVGGESVQGRLLGIVQPSGKYIFGDRAGHKVAEADRYRLALEMREGKLVVFDNSHLFDQALTEAFEVMRQQAV